MTLRNSWVDKTGYMMTEGQEQTQTDPGLIAFTKHYDTRLDNFGTRLSSMETKLSGEMGEIRALLTNALKNQDGVFTRLNRPIAPLIIAGFAVFISLAGVMATLLTLTVNPMKESINHLEATIQANEDEERDIHLMLNGQLIAAQVDIARLEESVRWQEKLEDRYNMRMHGALTQ